ncbi:MULTISPECIES: hypothetical protein [unclassified Acinetobacter]|uniref:hypothetical protein n=1 Tax=unclassified Acinetobacter TaxID=196816 RepID=UPI001F4AA3A5|nr:MULTISPECIES: hypothetical protein [unclassified Acinetobacter]MCH7353255.1 hypothetical protein [Acinetobacter sp. NIPH 2023]MCH7360637.1 hypothetical protein [Acinetobacter sp. NIPH 2024]
MLTKCPLLETTERYEFKTDVHQSFDASSEERIPLRDVARQSFNWSMMAFRNEVPEMFNDLYSWMRKEYLVPQPLESQLVGNLSDDFIETDTSNLGINVGTLILVQAVGVLEVVEVTEIGRYEVIEDVPVYIDGYRLNEAVTASNAKIIPLRKVIIAGNPTSQANGLMFKPTISLRVTDSIEYPMAADPQQYKGDDIYFTPLLLDGDFLDINFEQHQTIVDGDIGQFWQFTHWFNPLINKNFRVIMKSRQEYIDYKKWFYRRRGRLNQFWMPSYLNNFNLVSRNSTSITVKNDNFLSDRKNIAIKANGVWTAHTVISSVTSGQNIVMNISPSPPAVIDRVSYLGLYRLNSDAVEFYFKGADIVEATVPIVELSP